MVFLGVRMERRDSEIKGCINTNVLGIFILVLNKKPQKFTSFKMFYCSRPLKIV